MSRCSRILICCLDMGIRRTVFHSMTEWYIGITNVCQIFLIIIWNPCRLNDFKFVMWLYKDGADVVTQFGCFSCCFCCKGVERVCELSDFLPGRCC